MSGYSPDQTPEPESDPEPCPICGEQYECDEVAHQIYDEECGGSCGQAGCEYRCKMLGKPSLWSYLGKRSADWWNRRPETERHSDD